jgi:hypothetical protein
MKYIKVCNYGWDNELDTGFGNRIQAWSYAMYLNALSGYDFTIVVDGHMWKELEYLNFPYTKYIDDKTEILHYKPFEHGKFEYLEKYDNLEVGENLQPFIHENVGDSYKTARVHRYIFDCYSDITFLDKKLEKKIRNSVKNTIGIHSRKNNSALEDTYGKSMEEIKSDIFFNTIDELYPNSKFYLSTDILPGEVYTRPLEISDYFPNFKESDNEFLKEFYSNYDVIDYMDIIDESVILEVKSPINEKREWVHAWQSADPDTLLYKNYHLKILRDIIDLYSLVYCKKFLPGNSTWSDFIYKIRENRGDIILERIFEWE